MTVMFPLFSQVEKTKHYLLLREKLESTLLMGQESLQSCITEELNEPPQPAEAEHEVVSASEITTERQRELAAKVSYICEHVISGLTWPVLAVLCSQKTPDKCRCF